MVNVTNLIRSGDPSCSPMAMWFLDDEITLPEITFQLQKMREQGIYEFFIHPADGLLVDYLSEDFFRIIRHAAAEAERLGMKYWIYDEYNWPSGPSGGYLLREKPWARMQQLCMRRREAQPGETVTETLPPKDRADSRLLAVFAGSADNYARASAETDGDDCTYRNPSAVVQTVLFFFTAWNFGLMPCCTRSAFTWDQEGYLDTLDDEAVDAFIDRTHERYKAAIGEHFGKSAVGVFTDEPSAFSVYRSKVDADAMPWSRRFEERFLKENQYEVASVLPALFLDLQPGLTQRVRYDYWQTVRKMFIGAYMARTRAWCAVNGLLYTGHMLCEELLSANSAQSGDLYDAYAQMDMPGIDAILTYTLIDSSSFNLPGKLLASAAQWLGRRRTLCETYTLSGWDMSLRHMKRIANRLLLLGINGIQFMGATYSFNGIGKTLNGPTHNWQNPQFKYYHLFCHYVSALQSLIARTKIAARALMLYPAAAGRALLGAPAPRNPDALLNLQDRTIWGAVNALFELHVPYLVAFEQTFDQASVRDGRILLDGCEFDALIIPAATHVTAGSSRVIREFIRQGGRTVLINGIPAMNADTMADNGVSGMLNQPNVKLAAISSFDESDGKKARAGDFTFALRDSLAGLSPFIADVDYRDGLLSALRRDGDQYFLLLGNDSPDPISAQGIFWQKGDVRAICTDTGGTKAAHLTPVAGGTRFQLELDGFEVVLLEAAKNAPDSSETEAGGTAAAILPDSVPSSHSALMPTGGWRMTPCEQNVLVPVVYYVPEDEALRAAHSLAAAGEVCTLADFLARPELVRCVKINWLGQEFSDIGWQLPKVWPIPERHITSVQDFEIQEIPDTLELITEQYYPATWYLNGSRLFADRVERVWHAKNMITDIVGLVRKGANRLVALGEFPAFRTDFGVPCAVLRGNFRVFNDIMTLEPGGNLPACWNSQGYPHYIGDMDYSCDFALGSFSQVFLDLRTNDAATVLVNGTAAGERCWDPYRFDLTGACVPGQNRLTVRITPTGTNLYGKPMPSGLAEAPTLIVY